MPPRVLLTGATGFIGREVLASLVTAGCEVHTIGRSQPKRDQRRHHFCDLLAENPAAIMGSIAPTHFVHVAWYATPGRFWAAAENLDWIAASLTLVRAFAASGGKRLLIVGSCAEYDWSAPELDEYATPLKPQTLYGRSKASLFDILTTAAPALGLSLAWARIFIPYGPEEDSERLLGSLLKAIRTNAPAAFSSGTQERDFMHVADVASALTAILLSKIEGPVNVASGTSVAVRTVVETAAEIAGARHLLRFGERPLQPGEPPRLIAQTRRLAEGVGWKPRFDLDTGLRDVFQNQKQRFQ